MAELMKFAARLYIRLLNANPRVKNQVEPFLQEIRASGAIPLGLRPDAAGRPAYWWLVYDESILGPGQMSSYLQDHTPPGLAIVIVRL